MMSRLLLLLLSSEAARASLLTAPSISTGLRLRGGDVADALEESDLTNDLEDSDDDKPLNDAPLTEEQVFKKLNEIPTFCLMGKEGGFVALTMKDNGRTIPFFIEPEEAQAVLNMTQAGHPDEAIRLVSVGLGNALKLCRDREGDEEINEAFSSFDGHLRLQGSSKLMSAVEPNLKAMLAAAGFDEKPWLLPVFLCEELTRGEVLPVFFNPREIHEAWELNKLDPESFPEKFVMMDIRMMVADMQKEGTGMPWNRVSFIGAKGAAEFANELLAAQAAAASA